MRRPVHGRRRASFGPISEVSPNDGGEHGGEGEQGEGTSSTDHRLQSRNDAEGSEDVLLSHHYRICDVIEKGPVCTIYRATHRNTSRSYSVKSLDLRKYRTISGLSQEEIEREVEICASLKHPLFCRLHDAIYGDRALHLIFEHVEGQDIAFEVVKRAAAGFIYSEAVVSHYARQLLEALSILHSQGVVHRDVRPHNILLASKDTNAPLKLRGFGVAFALNSASSGRCPPGRMGIPQFMAPEMVAGRDYGKPLDVWAAGCVLYTLLAGKLPFIAVGDALYRAITAGNYSFSDPVWARISEPAKDLLRRMLEAEETARWTAQECLRHTWITNRQQVPRAHLAETVDNIRRYNVRRRLKSNITAAINNERWQRAPFAEIAAASAGGDSCDSDSIVRRTPPPRGGDSQPIFGGVHMIVTSLDQIALLTENVAATDNGSLAHRQIETVLNDPDLRILLQLYDKIRHEGIRPAAFNRDAEQLLTQIGAEVGRAESPSTELKELATLLKNAHLTAILQAQDVLIDEVFTSCASEKSSNEADELSPAITELAIGDSIRSTTTERRSADRSTGGAGMANGTLINPLTAADVERRKGERDAETSAPALMTVAPPRGETRPNDDDDCVKSPFFDEDNDDLLMNSVSRVRLVQFQKDSDEPMGITLKVTEDHRCFIARIMHGGMVHRQSTLHVGDEIREINGVDVRHQTIDALQGVLRDVRGNVQFKIVPSYRSAPPPCEIFVRAQFDYDPAEDDLIPCARAGVAFKTGDILQIISKEDHNWWQARFVCGFPGVGNSSSSAHTSPRKSTTSSAARGASPPPLANHVPPSASSTQASTSSHSKNTSASGGESAIAGLIPSPELQEWRTACLAMEQQRDSSHCAWLSRKKKYYTTKYLRKHSEVFEKLNLVTYEEVVRLASFRRKTLVLLGAHGVGRRMVKNYMIHRHPHRFAYPIPHTTRSARKDELDGQQYHFVSNDAMLTDIQAGEYLEYGSFEECMYGTKLETIRQIHRSGKMAILDVEPQALKVLRTAEYAPFVVFISAPDLKSLEDPDGSLENLVKESDELKAAFGHLIDFIIVNKDIDDTIRKLELVVEKLAVYPQWVPSTWLFS